MTLDSICGFNEHSQLLTLDEISNNCNVLTQQQKPYTMFKSDTQTTILTQTTNKTGKLKTYYWYNWSPIDIDN